MKNHLSLFLLLLVSPLSLRAETDPGNIAPLQKMYAQLTGLRSLEYAGKVSAEILPEFAHHMALTDDKRKTTIQITYVTSGEFYKYTLLNRTNSGLLNSSDIIGFDGTNYYDLCHDTKTLSVKKGDTPHQVKLLSVNLFFEPYEFLKIDDSPGQAMLKLADLTSPERIRKCLSKFTYVGTEKKDSVDCQVYSVAGGADPYFRQPVHYKVYLNSATSYPVGYEALNAKNIVIHSYTIKEVGTLTLPDGKHSLLYPKSAEASFFDTTGKLFASQKLAMESCKVNGAFPPEYFSMDPGSPEIKFIWDIDNRKQIALHN